jgi:hypothetical protein
VNRPKSQAKGTLDFYRCAYENGGFWSCFGYDGLAVIFELPVETVRSLSENEKRGLMALLFRLADVAYDDLRREVQALEDRSDEERLAGLLHLRTV